MRPARVSFSLLVVLAACSSGRSVATSSSSASPTNSPKPSATATVTLGYGPTWKHYSLAQVGLAFEFPSMPGTQACALDDHRHDSEGSGLGYFCDETLPVLTEADRNIGRGYKYSFIGTNSRDFTEGRDCWFTDVQRWFPTGPSKYLVKVNDPQHCDYTVRNPTILQRKDGTSAIVFDGNQSGSDYRNPSTRHYDKLAILNFPSGHSRYFQAVAFYFYDFADEQTGQGRVVVSMSDIRRVIDSVRYFRPPTF